MRLRDRIYHSLWVLTWLLAGIAFAMIVTGCWANPRDWFSPPHGPYGPPSPPSAPPTDTGPDVQTLWLLRINMLVACASVVATPVCIGLAIWLRSVMFATLALASIGMLIATMVTKWVLYHTEAMMWGVGALTILGVGGLLWHLHRNRKGLFGAVKVAEALKPPTEPPAIKDARKAMQIEVAGKASRIIDEARVRLGLKDPTPTNDPRRT